MPEKGWVALTVREHVGVRIKELAKAHGLTVSEYLEGLITINPGAKLGVGGEWATCNLCGVRLKARSIPEHISKVHPKSH